MESLFTRFRTTLLEEVKAEVEALLNRTDFDLEELEEELNELNNHAHRLEEATTMAELVEAFQEFRFEEHPTLNFLLITLVQLIDHPNL